MNGKFTAELDLSGLSYITVSECKIGIVIKISILDNTITIGRITYHHILPSVLYNINEYTMDNVIKPMLIHTTHNGSQQKLYDIISGSFVQK